MIHNRERLVLAALVVAIFFSMGTSSVSSVTADRPIEIAVADDSNAYMGFKQQPTRTQNGTTDLVVTVRNQYPSGTSFKTVSVTVHGREVSLSKNSPLEPGDTRTQKFNSIPCDSSITIMVSGTGINAEIQRTVSCR